MFGVVDVVCVFALVLLRVCYLCLLGLLFAYLVLGGAGLSIRQDSCCLYLISCCCAL